MNECQRIKNKNKTYLQDRVLGRLNLKEERG